MEQPVFSFVGKVKLGSMLMEEVLLPRFPSKWKRRCDLCKPNSCPKKYQKLEFKVPALRKTSEEVQVQLQIHRNGNRIDSALLNVEMTSGHAEQKKRKFPASFVQENW